MQKDKIPRVNQTTAIGGSRKVKAAGMPIIDTATAFRPARDGGCRYTINMRKPIRISMIPMITCSIAKIVTLAGLSRAGLIMKAKGCVTIHVTNGR
jgi:hypothetical protein